MTGTRPSQRRHPLELNDRAAHMVLKLSQHDPCDQGLIACIARHFGVGSESLRAAGARSRSTPVVDQA